MQLEWINNLVTDSEGDNYRLHYLVDVLSEQCLACIPEPRKGNLLFVTDIRVAGYDRSFMSLSAAKTYCECVAMQANLEGAKELSKQFEKVAESEGVKVAE